MLRYEIQHDDIGPFFIYLDTFLVRPFNKTTELKTMDKIMAKSDEKTEPFIYILQVKHNIKEWWFNTGFKTSNLDKDQVEWLRDRYRNKYLQLQK